MMKGSNESKIENPMSDLPSLTERGTRGEAVIAIFDIGKTNKKLLLFDEQYRLVHEQSDQLKETIDEDGFACEDVIALTKWVTNALDKILQEEQFIIKGHRVIIDLQRTIIISFFLTFKSDLCFCFRIGICIVGSDRSLFAVDE